MTQLSSRWTRIYCFDIEPAQEVIESSVLQHLINIYRLKSNCWLELHKDVILEAIEEFTFIIDWLIISTEYLSFLLPWWIGLLLDIIHICRLFTALSLCCHLLSSCSFGLLHGWHLNLSVFFEIFSYVHEHQVPLLDVFLIIYVDFHVELEVLDSL
jgi:hypothetical protein